MSHYYNNNNASNEPFTQNFNATTNTTAAITNDDNNNDVAIDQLWKTIMNEISTIESLNLKNLPLPFGRVKKIMKTIDVALLELKRIADESEDNSSRSNNHNKNDSSQIDDRRYRYTFMIANEVPYVMAKAAEMFIRDVTTRAWYHTDQNRRKTIQRPDIIHATSSTEMYDFLIDVIPHANDCNNNTTSATTTTTNDASPDPVMYTDMSRLNTNNGILHQQSSSSLTLPPSGNDGPLEPPIPSVVTQPSSVPESQQEEDVTINEFPTSYSTNIVENDEDHHHTNQMSLPPNPLTTNMIFSPLTTTTTNTNTTETQLNHHHHHLDTKTSLTNPPDDLHPDEQQQQQHSTTTPSCYYDDDDDDDALSSHPQEWTLE